MPVAHHIYGVPQTINTANYVIFLAFQEVMKLNNPEMVNVCTEELINLHRGQGIELYWRDSLTCPTEEEYLDMVNNSKMTYTSHMREQFSLTFWNRNQRTPKARRSFNASSK